MALRVRSPDPTAIMQPSEERRAAPFRRLIVTRGMLMPTCQTPICRFTVGCWLSACLLVWSGGVPVAAADEPPPQAGNAEVARIMQEFPGRGDLGDGSDPRSPEDTLAVLEVPEDLAIDLIASEPLIAQPLQISFDPQGRMWVVEYRQYPFPAGLKVVRYDQHLRAVFDRVPDAPPHHEPGRDRISVFTDTDGDGSFDQHQVAIDGLNIATSVAVGHGGIWVMNPPYLLHYPDADGDAVPDADPVVHLSGFGLEDTHSVANSLLFGPDGWLYGVNGSTTTAISRRWPTKASASGGITPTSTALKSSPKAAAIPLASRSMPLVRSSPAPTGARLAACTMFRGRMASKTLASMGRSPTPTPSASSATCRLPVTAVASLRRWWSMKMSSCHLDIAGS
jgi:hypothetical protein